MNVIGAEACGTVDIEGAAAAAAAAGVENVREYVAKASFTLQNDK